MTRRVLAALPLLFVALALGHASAWSLAPVLAVAILLVSSLGPRWEVDTGRQMLSSAIGAGVGYVLVSFAYEPEPAHLGDGWAKLCASTLLAALARSLLIAPRGAYSITLALAFAALSFAGKTPNPVYAIYVLGFLASGVWALGESTRTASLTPQARRVLMGAAVLVVAAGLGLGTIAGLHRLHAWAQGRTRYTTTSSWQPRVGFSELMDLGALDGLLDSDRRVLRVRGGRTDYLRGAVFDIYENGRWRRSEAAERETKIQLDADPGPSAIEISSISGREGRFFLPLQAEQVRSTPGAVRMDDVGAVQPAGKREAALNVRFVLGAAAAARLAPPRASDLHLSRRGRRRLVAIAGEWTTGATTNLDKLAAIESRLMHGYRYARAFVRSPKLDPVVDFLLLERSGHCEYFASALALLARAAGVPTRLVMGYRVTERSPFGYFVVRDRNAHSWVEAWVPGVGWTTHDATPADAQPNNREREASYFGSSLDALGVAYDDTTDWLGRRTLLETGIAWLVGCVVLAVIVARGARSRARRQATRDDEALLPFMRPLIEALDRGGHARRADEPLERLAERLPEQEAARLLRRYSDLRYGGIGDSDTLARDVKASVEAMRRRA